MAVAALSDDKAITGCTGCRVIGARHRRAALRIRGSEIEAGRRVDISPPPRGGINRASRNAESSANPRPAAFGDVRAPFRREGGRNGFLNLAGDKGADNER